jgi:dihydroorotase
MCAAMTYIHSFGGWVMHLPQDSALAADGVMHEGEFSTRLGLKGIPSEAETILLARDIELVRMTKCSYMAQQISAARSVEMIKAAKAEGLPVACGVSINHLLLTDEAIGNFRTFCKLTPPLRAESDRQALLEGVKDGTIDFIVSAHNPQSQEGKRVPFESAESGSISLETFLPALFLLHEQESIPLEILLSKTSPAPHRLAEGADANIVCFDDKAAWTLDVATQPLPSKTQNSALDGTTFTGKITMTLLSGEVEFNARAN